MRHCDSIWTDLALVTMRRDSLEIERGMMIAAHQGKIVHVGSARDIVDFSTDRLEECDGRLATPGLIDCHTHLVYAGDRSSEHAKRRAGATYEDLAKQGGGILSTVKSTRQASQEELVHEALPRLDALIAEGVTTIEIKSGYGLDLANELKMLRAARRLAEERSISVRTTFLGAHAFPWEFRHDPAAYVETIIEEMLPAISAHGLADAVDAYCESIGFSADHVGRIFAAARKYDLPVKLHAEQLSNQHAAKLAAQAGALSADHLEYLDAGGIAAMAQAGTVATLLPGAYYFMREERKPPVVALRAAGVRMAVATDCNPGTSPLTSLLLAMNMGAVLFGLTVEECIAGATINAARALGIDDRTGSIETGKACDLAIWNVDRPDELINRIGCNPLYKRIREGA